MKPILRCRPGWWPLGFYVGVIAAGFFLLGQGWAAARRHGSAPLPRPALSAVQ